MSSNNKIPESVYVKNQTAALINEIVKQNKMNQ